MVSTEKLRKLYERLKDIYLNYDGQIKAKQGLKSTEDIYNILSELESYPFFKEELKLFSERGKYSDKDHQLLKVMLSKLEIILSYIHYNEADINKIERAEILLPSNIDFKDLGNISNDFHKIFKSPVFNEEIRINEVKRGSIILIIALSTFGLTTLATLTTKALKIAENVINFKKSQEILRTLQNCNKHIESLEEMVQDYKKEAYHLAANEIINENTDLNGRTKEESEVHILDSIERLNNMILSGVQVAIKLDTNTEEKASLPKWEDYSLLQEGIKLLNNLKS